MLAQSRTTISFLLLAPVLWVVRGRARLVLPWRDALRGLLLGVGGLAVANYTYYLAIQKTTVATAIILQYTAPVWVLLFMLVTRRQRATWPRTAGVVLAVAGCVFAIGTFAGQARFPFLTAAGILKLNTIGVLAAQAAAVSFAFYNVYGRHMVKRYDHWVVITYALLGSSLLWIVVNPPWKIIAMNYTSGQWAFLVLFAVVSMLVPFSFYFAGLNHLDATRAIVTSCLEPVFCIVIAAATLGEAVSGLQVAGIALVLGATVLVQRPEGKEQVEVVELGE
jgi:drug/metabolite transporter (DMT)-like permease